jgi:hypothetical protein
MDESIHVPPFLGRKVLIPIEALHFPGEMAGEIAGIKAGDAVNAGLTGQDVGPAFSHRISNGADQTKSSNDNATTAHAVGVIQFELVKNAGPSSRWIGALGRLQKSMARHVDFCCATKRPIPTIQMAQTLFNKLLVDARTLRLSGA